MRAIFERKKKRYRLRLSLRNTYTYGQRIPPTNDRIFCMIKYEETRDMKRTERVKRYEYEWNMNV